MRPPPSLPPEAPFKPYVLVADDDPTSLHFLGDALRQLGARVVTSPDGDKALERARAEAFDLLLLDRCMPQLDAMGVLQQLHDDVHAPSATAIAVVSSAELDAHEQHRLLDAGFHTVLLKPCTLSDLGRLLALVSPSIQSSPLLDDDAALQASGTAAIMTALRKLFRQELITVYDDLDALSSNAALFETRLHKLRSSCGFCGATSLSNHIVSLQRHLKRMQAGEIFPLVEFRRSLLQTIEALDS